MIVLAHVDSFKSKQFSLGYPLNFVDEQQNLTLIYYVLGFQ